jgi:hypothetical protein
MTSNVLDQIKSAYREMTKARYRPAAPSDGHGNITIPEEELNLQREADKYARRWWKEEDDRVFSIGCCDFRSRRATIYAVEAAREMCAGMGGVQTGLKLLKMAVKEMESVAKEIQ